MSLATLLLGLVVALVAAALMSEASFRTYLTPRGRVVTPVLLALITWIVWAGVGAIVAAVIP